MQTGDNILITYTNDIKKVATFKHSYDGKNLFTDITGDFILTDKFIKEKDIKLTVIEL